MSSNELEETEVGSRDLTTLDSSSSSSSSSWYQEEEDIKEATRGPNYMKTTSSSTAKETLQKKSAATSLTKLSSFKQGRWLFNTGWRRTWMRRSSAGAEFQRRLSKSRSIKPGRVDRRSSGSVSNQSMEVETGASTFRPLRRLTKVASLRTRRPPSKKIYQVRDLHAEKATCSSALKESKFSDHLDLETGGTPAQGIASGKVCPYSYCSLHGHHHASASPVMGFVTTRRHQLHAPKSKESRSKSFDTKVANHTKDRKSTETRKGDHQNGSRDSSSAAEETRGKQGETRSEEVNGVGFNQKAGQIASTINTGGSGPNISEHSASTELADHSFDDIGSLETNVTVETRSVGDMDPDSGTVTEELLAKSKEANKDSAQELPKVKQVRMWNLIYKKMVSGLAAEEKSQTSDEKIEETDQQKSFNAFPGINISKENKVGDREGEIRDIFLYQNNAIKIVQEAFDKILSEIPDQSSDDKSVDKETISDMEAEDINPFKGTQLSISNFSDSLKDEIENHPDELGMPVDSSKCLNEEGTELNEGKNLEKKEFKSWSNVKKIVMLNRFVKALEKVKNINPRKPNILPEQPHSEAEKVNLRHLTLGGRKQSEEWMLDYALQKVIFTLAPAQKRKVAMLVQAFQTIIPEMNTPLTQSSDIISSLTTSVDSFPNSPDQSTSEKETELGDDISKQEERLIYSCAAEDHISQETNSRSCFSMEKGSSNDHETDVDQQTSIQEVAETRSMDKPEVTNAQWDQEAGVPSLEVPKEVCLEPALKAPDLNSEPNNQKLEGENQIETFEQSLGPNVLTAEQLVEHGNVVALVEPSEMSYKTNEAAAQLKGKLDAEQSVEHGNVVALVEPSEMSYETNEAEAQLKGKFVQLFSSLDESQPNPARRVPQEHNIEKQLNTRLWYLIYKHMASGSTTPLEGEDRERGSGANDSTDHLGQQGSSETNNISNTDHEETDDLEQIEAIRLVEEAIDEIPFPETQEDLRDDRPVSPKKKDLVATEVGPATEGHEAENTNIDKEVKVEPSIGSKLKHGTTKRWSNVKKLILLQRFMKSMEKVKKINPAPPQFIPLDPTKVAEKVNLRHQVIGDRRSSDEWMLDHTLQRVVSKLTPARKRKVQLLVEAFETVIPPNWTK